MSLANPVSGSVFGPDTWMVNRLRFRPGQIPPIHAQSWRSKTPKFITPLNSRRNRQSSGIELIASGKLCHPSGLGSDGQCAYQ